MDELNIGMSEFLNLIEQYDPHNTEDPKWMLIDFLKTKGIDVSIVRDTDMIYINTGHQVIAVTVSVPEESSEENDVINDIAQDPTNKLNSQATQINKTKESLAPKVIQNANARLQNLQKELQKPVKQVTR